MESLPQAGGVFLGAMWRRLGEEATQAAESIYIIGRNSQDLVQRARALSLEGMK